MSTEIESTVDRDAALVTFVAHLDVAPERAWQAWVDPRLLERWWGPPTWPATFTRHEPEVDGQSRYVMTGPDGETAGGWWRVLDVVPPRRFAFEDGFAGDDGEPDPDSPYGRTRTDVTLEPEGSGTLLTLVSHFVDVEQLDLMLGMQMREGMTQALGQMPDVLAG